MKWLIMAVFVDLQGVNTNCFIIKEFALITDGKKIHHFVTPPCGFEPLPQNYK